MSYKESEKTTNWNLRILKLKAIMEKCDPIEDADLESKCQIEMNDLVEKILKEEDKVNPLIAYQCGCGFESVHFKNEKKIKRCLNCNQVIVDDREQVA